MRVERWISPDSYRLGLNDQAAVFSSVLSSFLLFLGMPSGNALAGVLPFMPRPWCGPPGVVADHVGIEHGLHLLDGLEPGLAAFDPEVLVEQSAVQALDDAVGLRPADTGPFVLDAFELEEQLIRMLVLAAARSARHAGHGAGAP